MNNTFNSPGTYRIEVSGWGLDNCFFDEKTEILWSQTGDKYVLLHRTLLEGAMIFVRLLDSEPKKSSVPVPFQVKAVRAMDCNGQCEMRLEQMTPRIKAPNRGVTASYRQEDSQRPCELSENALQLEPEEILQ
jgi:hypothetical protein